MQVGTYVANGPRQNGTWTPQGGLQLVDPGVFWISTPTKDVRLVMEYASKDFYDPVGDRRILWGWVKASLRTNTMTLPREVTWHPQLLQLVFSPVKEQASLRRDVIGVLGRTALPLDQPVAIGAEPPGNQTEVAVSFARPTAPGLTRFNLTVPASFPSRRIASPAMQGIVLTLDYSDSSDGEVVVVRCLRANFSTSVKLLPTDTTIDIRVYTDGIVVEIYVMGGRTAITLHTYALPGATNATAVARISVTSVLGRGEVVSASAWKVGAIWVSTEEVLATPRKKV
jgi:sucrose-6-phosphate hydrolase SacC (GH32 family)